MARTIYAPEIKAAILKAATEARAADKPWTETFEAAKAVGYTGTAGGLKQMLLRAAGGNKKAGRRVKQARAAKQSRKPVKRSQKPAVGAKRFDPADKAAIIEAASNAREAGKSWPEALEAAKKAGYAGSLLGIARMIQSAQEKAVETAISAKRGPGRPPKSATPAKRGPGRPPKTAIPAKRGPGRPPKTQTSGLSGIEAMIENVVKERVSEAIERAIEVLQQMKGA